MGANWELVAVNNAISAAGMSVGTGADQVSSLALHNAGLFYDGLVALGNGAPITSVLWGCIFVFIIRNTPIRGIIAAVLGAALTFVGAIHTSTIGIAQTTAMPSVWGYLLIAGFLAYKPSM
ncbi:hypothetical protein QFZ31_003032 [Neobacillus niacini]|uniref:hypothetical protein n=1 Tax=Neobacillus driksii TaxID=3035913 RepID=UPI0027847224|nr:hypothetical protein [Neobacillus niacini]MDQ0973154.1 hypothetical protein [Neobacillus niacini]